jgi:glycosyltransferase involved in cell wall biosynthesis
MREVMITVGVCVKNASMTIREALKGITSQDYPRAFVEIIVVDGKSVDGTLGIIKNHLSRFDFKVYYFSDEGAGLGTARQIIVDKAKGKYVIWVDGDVILPSGYFRSQVEFMEKNSLVGATRGIENLPNASTSLLPILECTRKLSYYRSTEKTTLSTFAGTFRTSAMRMAGGFDKCIKGAGEDIDLAYGMREKGWSLKINQAPFYAIYRSNWKELREQSEWYGYGGYYVFQKRKTFEDFWARILPIGFFVGIRDFFIAYRASGAKIAILLPFYRLLRDFFWWVGFFRAYFDNYKPEIEEYLSIIPFSEELESAETGSGKAAKVPVSIGLVVKDCADTIRDTINCILTQDYPQDMIEVVVIDDKSKDNTISIIAEGLAKHSFKHKIYRASGQGLGFARQMVVNNAHGKHILWIDGDMVLPRNHVRLQVDFMEKYPDIGKARAIWKIMEEKEPASLLESMRLLKDLSGNRKSGHWQGIGGSICRTDALREIGGFDTEILGAGEDIDLTIRLAAYWKIGLSRAVFYHHFRRTWPDLWKQYIWYGYGMHYVNNKHRKVIKLWTYLPFVGALSAIPQMSEAFRLTRKKTVFLLPFQFFFKYSAWIYGYIVSHFDGYGHARK